MNIKHVVQSESDIGKVTISVDTIVTEEMFRHLIRLSEATRKFEGIRFLLVGPSGLAVHLDAQYTKAFTPQLADDIKALLNAAEDAAKADAQRAKADELLHQEVTSDFISSAAKAFGVPVQ